MEPDCRNDLYITATLAQAGGAFKDCYYCQTHAKILDINLLLPQFPVVPSGFHEGSYESCRLYAVLFVYKTEQNILILKARRSNSIFATEAGYLEAATISNLAKRTDRDFRVTHDLIQTLIESVGASLITMAIDDYDSRQDRYVSRFIIEKDEQTVEVGCRASDIIALSLVYDMDVDVDKGLLGRML